MGSCACVLEHEHEGIVGEHNMVLYEVHEGTVGGHNKGKETALFSAEKNSSIILSNIICSHNWIHQLIK
jgi:hypothetical protein